MLCFLLKYLEAAHAESMRKGTKKPAKNKMKWDLFSFLPKYKRININFSHFTIGFCLLRYLKCF